MKEVITELQKMSGHEFIELCSRGNSAIHAALHCAMKITGKGKVLIADQGGWMTYRKYAELVGMDVEEVKTDKGVIDIEDLNSKVDEAKVIIYQDYAGYFARQDVEKIYSICKGHCIVILDVTASLGREVFGEFCDISLGSFGRWKPVNLEYGGFLSTNRKVIFENSREILEKLNFEEKYDKPLLEKLKGAADRQRFLADKCETVKKDLVEFDMIHKESKGINVVVGFKDDAEKEKILKYCEKNNYEYTLCPREIRVNENAVSIEIKRL